MTPYNKSIYIQSGKKNKNYFLFEYKGILQGTEHKDEKIAIMTTRGRLDWIDNPLVSTDTFFYLSKCASLPSSCATRGLFANFAGYLV